MAYSFLICKELFTLRILICRISSYIPYINLVYLCMCIYMYYLLSYYELSFDFACLDKVFVSQNCLINAILSNSILNVIFLFSYHKFYQILSTKMNFNV